MAFEITDAEVMALLKKWKLRLGLTGPWSFTVEINRTPDSVSRKNQKLDGWVDIRAHYFLADFTFNLFTHDSHEALEETIVHELLHVVVAPVVNLAQLSGGRGRERKRWKKIVTHAEESVITVLSKAIVKQVRE